LDLCLFLDLNSRLEEYRGGLHSTSKAFRLHREADLAQSREAGGAECSTGANVNNTVKTGETILKVVVTADIIMLQYV
jgi:hypothetical protein